MIERVRPAQLTTIVVCRIRRDLAGAQHQFRAGHADRAGDVHGRIFVEAADIEDGDIGLARDQAGDFVRRQRGRVPARLDQFAKSFCIRIHILEQFVSRHPPGLQPAVELTDVGVAQRRETIRSLRNEAFAGVVENDRRVLARQPRFGFERDPLGRHVGGKQRMAGGKGSLVPEIEQRDFLAQR